MPDLWTIVKSNSTLESGDFWEHINNWREVVMATVDQVRTLVNDPIGDDQIFDDAHYQVIIDIEDNIYRAAATAAKTLAAYFAEKVSVAAGPVRVESQMKFKHYMALADTYDQRAREGGGSGAGSGAGSPAFTGTSLDEIQSVQEDEDRYGSVFFRGLDENPGTTPGDDSNI